MKSHASKEGRMETYFGKLEGKKVVVCKDMEEWAQSSYMRDVLSRKVALTTTSHGDVS